MTLSVEAPAARPGRMRLFGVLAGLYVAQAIPSYLFAAAIPPIMREQGVSRTEIGYISILFLPLVLKFLWAPWVDRIRPVARAHRASWVFLTQAGIVASILALLWVDVRDAKAVLAIGMVASLLLSTQDIATDGYAAKYLPVEDRAIGNAIQGGAVALGVVAGGTLGLVLYHHAGWNVMLLVIAAISTLPLIAAAMMRESDGPADEAAPRPSIMAFLRRPEARQILWIALIYRASEGFVKAMEGPYLVDAGVPLNQIGYLSGVSAATAGLAGSAIAAGAAGFQTLIRYMEIVALYSLFMAVSSSEQPGTDFTILACAQLVVYLAGSLLSGRIADALGYGWLFALSTALSGVAVLATLRLLAARSAVVDGRSPQRA